MSIEKMSVNYQITVSKLLAIAIQEDDFNGATAGKPVGIDLDFSEAMKAIEGIFKVEWAFMYGPVVIIQMDGDADTPKTIQKMRKVVNHFENQVRGNN